MIKSTEKVNSILRRSFFLGGFGIAMVAAQAGPRKGHEITWADPGKEHEVSEGNEFSVDNRKEAVQRARKILNRALFEAIIREV
jgi:hypothetical protein